MANSNHDSSQNNGDQQKFSAKRRKIEPPRTGQSLGSLVLPMDHIPQGNQSDDRRHEGYLRQFLTILNTLVRTDQLWRESAIG